MTVRTRRLVNGIVGLVAVGLVFGGLSVEVFTHSQVSRAQRALPGALARAVPTEADGAAAARQLAAARRHALVQDFEGAAEALEGALEEQPSVHFHTLAAAARLADGDGIRAGRHATLAARLAPDDAQLAAAAERALDLAVAFRVRPASRPLLWLAGFVCFALVLGGMRRGRERRRREAFLDDVSGRLRLWADGEPLGRHGVLKPGTQSVIVDVFLSGRYGMACPRRPKKLPTLHLAWSNAHSSQTLRLRAVKDVETNAVRVQLQPETLEKIFARPGNWRLHARLGEKPLVSLPVSVAPPLPQERKRLFGLCRRA